MKKNKFFWASAAIAALTLTACADQDEFNQTDLQRAAVENSPGAIQFGTYLGANSSTRAPYAHGTIYNTGDNALTNAKFGVFAYYTVTTNWTNENTSIRPNFMYNQMVEYDNTLGAWKYDNPKYWPNGIDAANAANDPSNTAVQTEVHKVSFFAYAPWAQPSGTMPAGTAYTAFDYGDGPIGATLTNYNKTNNYGADVATTLATGGVIGITDNAVPNGTSQLPWVNYVMRNIAAQDENDAIENQVIDLLWGLRGQYKYDETDNDDNTIKELGTAYNTDLTKQSVGEKVRFLFKHALAKVGGNESSHQDGKSESNKHRSGLKVVLDIDDNSAKTGTGADNQSAYLGTTFNDNGDNATKTLVTIREVKIQDGTSASADNTNAITDTKSNLLNYGWFNLATGEWKNQGMKEATAGNGSPMIYNIKVPDATNKYYLNPEIAEAGATLTNWTGADWNQTSGTSGYTGNQYLTGVVNAKAKNVFADTYLNSDGTTFPNRTDGGDKPNDIPALVVIPSGTGNTETQKIYVTVDYIVRTADANLNTNAGTTEGANPTAKAYTEVEQIISNEVELKGLEANKYYTLVMHLGLTSVKFEAVVSDWAPGTESKSDENGETTGDGTEEQRTVWLPSNVVNTTTIYADAGTKFKKVTVADTETSYTIYVTGLAEGSTIAAAKDGSSDATIGTIAYYNADGSDGGSSVPAGGYATVPITLVPTTTAAKTNTITITETPDALHVVDNPTTVVVITQQMPKLILTSDTKSIEYNGAFTITATHPNGAAFNLTGTPTVTVKEGETSTDVAFTQTIVDNKITITPAHNTAAKDRTLKVSITDGNGIVCQEPVYVVQGAATASEFVVSLATGTNPLAKAANSALTIEGKLAGADVTLDAAKVTKSAACDWLTITQDTSDIKDVKITATENTLGVKRSATITIKYTDDRGTEHTAYYVVEQAGA